MADSISSWKCSKCTFINADEEGNVDAKLCMMCEEPRQRPSLSVNDCATDAAVRGSSPTDFINKSVRFSDLIPAVTPQTSDDSDGARRKSRKDSITALGHMSFAAWESDRQSWTCKSCTFLNQPRFLVCGACGMAEGGSAGVQDELVTSGLHRMSLSSAQDFLMKAAQEQLDRDGEDKVRHERAVEVLDEQIRKEHDFYASNVEQQLSALDIAEPADQKQSPAMTKARKHIDTLERIQEAEKEEHEEMLFTIESWRMALQEHPDEEQEQEMRRQELMLQGLLKM